jgi:hypothetical protein
MPPPPPPPHSVEAPQTENCTIAVNAPPQTDPFHSSTCGDITHAAATKIPPLPTISNGFIDDQSSNKLLGDDGVKQQQQPDKEKTGRRERICREIVETEESYLQSLFTLERLFIQPLRIAARTPQPLLSHRELNDLFSNIDDIIKVYLVIYYVNIYLIIL